MVTEQNLRGNPPAVPGLQWIRLLGIGGLAEVHLFHQTMPSRDVAVKVLKRPGDAAGRAELAREANALSAVSGHPAIVTLYQAGEATDGQPYLAMEYCPVADIADQVRARPMATQQALEWMIRLASGVETLHRAGYVHGDIKPSNLMVTRFGTPVLGDFGVATKVGERYPHGRYSALWASPEQQVGEAGAQPVQDVWSLAATMWTLLAGHSPFEQVRGDNDALSVASRVQAGVVSAMDRGDVPPGLVDVLRSAMTVDSGRRIPSAMAFALRLQGVQTIMHLPTTPLEVAGAVNESSTPVIDDNRTVLRGMSRVGAEPASQPTYPAEPAPSSEPRALKGGRLRVVLWILIAIVGCAAAVTAWMLGINGTAHLPEPPIDVQPVDPIDELPPPVENLQGEITDGTITWTWTSEEDSNNRYLYTITQPDGTTKSGQTTRSLVTIKAQDGQFCIDVVAANDNGRQSANESSCVTKE